MINEAHFKLHWGSARSKSIHFYVVCPQVIPHLNTCKSLDQTKLPLGLKSGEVGSPLDTLALLNCCCSCRILGATGAADPADECGGCEWMSTAAVTIPIPYMSPVEVAVPDLLSGLP